MVIVLFYIQIPFRTSRLGVLNLHHRLTRHPNGVKILKPQRHFQAPPTPAAAAAAAAAAASGTDGRL